MTPTLTLNDGAALGSAAAVHAANDAYSTSTLADLCGIVGHRAPVPAGGSATFQARHARRAASTPQSTQCRGGDRVQAPTGTTSRRTSAWRGGPTCRAAGCAAARRSGAGDGARRLLGVLQPRAHGSRSPASTAATRQPRSTPTAPQPAAISCCPARPGRCCSATRPPRSAGDSRGSPSYPLAPIAVNSDDINIFDPDSSSPYARSCSARLPARARRTTWRSKSATSATGNVNGWTTENWNEITSSRTDSSTSSSSRRRTCGRHIAAGCGTRQHACLRLLRRRAPARRRCRSTSPTSAGIPAARAGDAAATPATNWTNSAWTGISASTSPIRRDAAHRPARERGRSAPTPSRPACPRTSS